MELITKAIALLPYLIAVNVVLSGVAGMVHGISEAFGKSDAPIVKGLGNIAAILKKVIDFASANNPHK